MAEPIYYKPTILGFAPYSPRKDAQQVLDHVGEVLDTYADSLPLTLRQCYYRLVGAFGYPKSDAFYQRLSTILARARRAGMIDWGAIRDDGVTVRHCGGGHDGLDDFKERVLSSARWYSRDKSFGQPRQVFVICEAAGMVPQLVSAVGDYPAVVRSSGGMDSVTSKFDLARSCTRDDTVVLHVGDLDPTGLSIFTGIHDDVRAMMEDICRARGQPAPRYACKRVTVLPEHVETYDLLTGTAKTGDAKKSWYLGINGDPLATCEAEALPPDVLQQLIREAVEAEIDMAAYQRAVALGEAERRQAMDAVAALEFDGRDA